MPPYAALVQSIVHRLRDFALFLPNPTFANPVWETASLHVLVARLSPFTDVQRSTPHLLLAERVHAAVPNAYVDMSFLPQRSDAVILEEAGVPLLLGTQSCRPAGDFDVVLVSNAWLMEQVNLPYLLSHSGVPVHAVDRGDQWPPLVLGGSNAAAAHALVAEDGGAVPDAFFFGEGEEALPNIASICLQEKEHGKLRVLARLAAEVRGLWVAGTPGPVKKERVSAAFLESQHPTSFPVLPGEEAGTVRLSITRGCPCLCSFCFEGFDRKPFREVPVGALLETAALLKRHTGADTVEVDSFAFSTHQEIGAILVGLHRLFLRVNVMSQRVDVLAHTPGLLDLEILAGKAGYTLGVEGISDRMRAFLHKSLPAADVRSVLESLHARRTREIKLFFLLTGREEDADLSEFAALVTWLKGLRVRAASLPRMIFSFGLLIRMPFTPLRHDPWVLDDATWRGIAGRVKASVETNGFEFRLSQTWADALTSQVLATGGPGVHDLLLRLAAAGPATDAPLTGPAQAAVAEWVTVHRQGLEEEKPQGHHFPFPFLDDAGTRAALFRQYQRARRGEDVGYGRAPTHQRATASHARALHGGEVAAAARGLAPLVERKKRLVPVAIPFTVPREAAGMGARWTEAQVMRSLLGRFPEQTENILCIREAVVGPLGIAAPGIPWFGSTHVEVSAWDPGFLRTASGTGRTAVPPHDVKSLEVRLTLPAAPFPDPAGSLAVFLRDHHAPLTITRSGPITRFEVPQKSTRKRMLLAGTCAPQDGGFTLALSIGTRPFLGAWLEESGTGNSRRALLEIVEGS